MVKANDLPPIPDSHPHAYPVPPAPTYKYPMPTQPSIDLRDYFAAKAMQALLMSLEEGKEHQVTIIPKTAYDMADLMMEARK